MSKNKANVKLFSNDRLTCGFVEENRSLFHRVVEQLTLSSPKLILTNFVLLAGAPFLFCCYHVFMHIKYDCEGSYMKFKKKKKLALK